MQFDIVMASLERTDRNAVARAVETFNEAQGEFAVNVAIDLPVVDAHKPVEWGELHSTLCDHLTRDAIIAVTSLPFTDNWFSHTEGSVSGISLATWRELFSPPGPIPYLLSEFALTAYFRASDISECDSDPHESTIGCLLDLCVHKPDIRWKMQCGYICGKHRELFLRHGGTATQLRAIDGLLEETRKTSLGQFSNKAPQKSLASSCDVLVVSALQAELDAFRSAAGVEWRDSSEVPTGFRSVQNYSRSEIQRDDGATARVVAAASTQMGLTACAVLTTQALHLFRPSMVIMTGIAAGVRGDGRELGDVLIAHPSFNYSAGKIRREEEGGFSPDYRPIEMPDPLLAAILRLSEDKAIFQTIHDEFPGNKPRAVPQVILGPMGSADYVVDDSTHIRSIQQHQRKLIGVDMETYAVYRSCKQSCVDPAPSFVSAKAICDFASEKTDDWQAYARYTSANLVREIIARCPYP